MIARLAEPHPPRATPSVLLAADGGGTVGFGHLGRCLALWQELGDASAFAPSGEDAGAWLARRGAATAAAQARAPVIVLDRIAPVTTAEVQELHDGGARVALLDDPGPARASADLVIDPPTGHDWPPAAGRRLGGFEHALVRREVRAAADAPLADVGVLLTLGGSDPQGLTPAIAQALNAAGIPSTTVLGPGYRGAPIAGALRDPADFARAIAGAELVVTAYGHTLIEAAHLGVPCVALAVRDADAADAEAFCAHGFATWIDLGGGPAPEQVAAEVARLHADPGARAAMSERGRALVDGRGAARVAIALRELA